MTLIKLNHLFFIFDTNIPTIIIQDSKSFHSHSIGQIIDNHTY